MKIEKKCGKSILLFCCNKVFFVWLQNHAQSFNKFFHKLLYVVLRMCSIHRLEERNEERGVRFNCRARQRSRLAAVWASVWRACGGDSPPGKVRLLVTGNNQPGISRLHACMSPVLHCNHKVRTAYGVLRIAGLYEINSWLEWRARGPDRPSCVPRGSRDYLRLRVRRHADVRFHALPVPAR